MKREEYMDTQNDLIRLARQSLDLNLEGFIEAISHAEAVGPVMDPTLYRKAMDNLQGIKKLAQAMLTVQEATENLTGVVINTAAAEFAAREGRPPTEGA